MPLKQFAILLLLLSSLLAACSSGAASGGSSSANPSASKNGEYPARGKITKINTTLGSVELDHEDIPNLMPAMRMEFYLKDKAMLDGIAVGDNVDFTILYRDGTETISRITPR